MFEFELLGMAGWQLALSPDPKALTLQLSRGEAITTLRWSIVSDLSHQNNFTSYVYHALAFRCRHTPLIFDSY